MTTKSRLLRFGSRIRHQVERVLFLLFLFLSGVSHAQNDPPEADAVLDEIKEFLGDAFEVGAWVIIAGGYMVAGYIMIMGGYRFFTGRDGALGQFLLGAAVALVMIMLMTYFLTTGQDQIGNLT